MENKIYVTENRTDYELRFGNSTLLVRFVKKIPSAEFDMKSGCWHIQKTDKLLMDAFCYYAKSRFIVSDVVHLSDPSEAEGIADRMPTLRYPHHLLLEPYDYQKKGIQYMVVHKRTFNCDDMGLGKDQPYSEPVLTDKGWSTMGELNVGDIVIAGDGTRTKVLRIFEQGEKECFKVSFSDGTSTRCGREHLWSVQHPNWARRHGKEYYKTLTLDEIMQKYKYQVVDKRYPDTERWNYMYSIPVCGPVDFKTGYEPILDPYVLGVIIGDGCLRKICHIVITKPNEELRKKVAERLNNGDTVTDFKYDNGITFAINKGSNVEYETQHALVKLGLYGEKSVSKFIPKEYLTASIQVRKDLLEGLLDTDGHKIKDDVWEYSTASERLAIDFAELSRSLGYIVRVSERESYYEKGGKLFRSWRIYIYGPKARKIKTIVNIESAGKEKSRCIMVDNKDHRYITKDYIVTHNTFQTIAAVDIANSYPCLVVCPASMKITWQREFKRFTGKNSAILDDKNKDRWHYYIHTGTCKVFITNYESVKKFFILGCKTKRVTVKNLEVDSRMRLFKSVVIDECHRCKEASTLWSKYLEAMCKGKEYVYMLTGTPIVTGNKDLVQQLKIMGRINDFGGAAAFKDRYCQPDVGYERLSELNYRLWETCYFRRDKSLVLKELPEKIRQYNVLEITNRSEYEKAELDLIDYLQKYKEADDEAIQKALRGYVIVQINVLRQITAEGKLQEALKSIHDIVDAGNKLIVFVAHKSLVKSIKKEFKGAVKVTGDDSPEQKQKAIDAFQNNEDCNLIVVNIKSGGVGITLTAASNILFLEFPWTAADCDQCECRAHRNGQKNVVTCTYLLGRSTFDEKMYSIIQKEREQAGIVTGAKDSAEERIFDLVNNIYKDKIK